MFLKPVQIPGTAIRPKDKPNSKQCPHCKRYYSEAVPKREGRKVTFHCPFCGEKVG